MTEKPAAEPRTALELELVYHLPDSLGDNAQKIRELFAHQICDGRIRSADPYFTNDRNHNVGMDVLIAAEMASGALVNLPEESGGRVVTRIIERLGILKAQFKQLYPDPDGYGAATFGQLERELVALAPSLAVKQQSGRGSQLRRAMNSLILFLPKVGPRKRKFVRRR